MLFCPRCANLLSTTTSQGLFFNCVTCTYSFAVEHKMVWRTPGNKKKLDEVHQFQDRGELTNMANCPKCYCKTATYYQLQTRSADEPMTNFYTCQGCQHKYTD